VSAAAEGHNASADVTIYLVCLGILCRIISFVYLLLLSIRDMLVVQVALCHLFEINFTKYIRHLVQIAQNSNTNTCGCSVAGGMTEPSGGGGALAENWRSPYG